MKRISPKGHTSKGALVLGIGFSIIVNCSFPVWAVENSEQERLNQRLESCLKELSDSKANKDDKPGEYIVSLYRLSRLYRELNQKEKSIELSKQMIEFYLRCDSNKVKNHDALYLLRNLDENIDSMPSEQLENYFIDLLTRFESLKPPARNRIWVVNSMFLMGKIGKQSGVEKEIALYNKWVAICKRYSGQRSEFLFPLLIHLKSLYGKEGDTRRLAAVEAQIANLDYPPNRKAELKVESAFRRVKEGDGDGAKRDWQAACKFVNNDFSKVGFHHILVLLGEYRERGMYQEVNAVLDTFFDNPTQVMLLQLRPFLIRMVDEFYLSGSLDAAHSLIQRRIEAGARANPPVDSTFWIEKLEEFDKASKQSSN